MITIGSQYCFENCFSLFLVYRQSLRMAQLLLLLQLQKHLLTVIHLEFSQDARKIIRIQYYLGHFFKSFL